MEDTIKIHERISSLEQDSKSVHRRLDNLEQLVQSVHILATEMKATREEVDSFGTRLEVIEHKPLSDAEVYEGVSLLFTVCTSLISWWRNNSFTPKAIYADKILHSED